MFRYESAPNFVNQIPDYYGENRGQFSPEELCGYYYQFKKQEPENGAGSGYVGPVTYLITDDNGTDRHTCRGDYNYSRLPGMTIAPLDKFLFRYAVSCPSATLENQEYDTQGCGCSNRYQKSLFDGVDGGEEGCKAQIEDKNPVCSGTGNTDSPVTANPCDIRTGAKYRSEKDFSYGGFTLTRNYHSLNLVDLGFGRGWHNQYLKNLSRSGDSLSIYEGTGRGEPWTKDNGIWIGDDDSDYLVTESISGYTITLKQGDLHQYNASGQLLSETDTQGKIKIFEYDSENRLIKVLNHYQQFITLEYSTNGKNHIVKVSDAQGVEYRYEYDSNDNLTAVVYPDMDSDPSNNPKRIYHYEDTNFPNHITGITNAKGERYANFAYDENGKAIESALSTTTNSMGQQRVQLNYQETN